MDSKACWHCWFIGHGVWCITFTKGFIHSYGARIDRRWWAIRTCIMAKAKGKRKKKKQLLTKRKANITDWSILIPPSRAVNHSGEADNSVLLDGWYPSYYTVRMDNGDSRSQEGSSSVCVHVTGGSHFDVGLLTYSKRWERVQREISFIESHAQ
jgi:hypothetical protein